MQYGRLGRRSGLHTVCLLGGLVAGLAGCDGSGGTGQAAGDGGLDAGAREGGTSLGGDAPKVGGVDARIPRTEPVISQVMKKLPLTGRVALVGSGLSSCTNQEPAPGDRWCGFSKGTELGREELWVVNVSAVAAGTPVQCTGTDPNCLRLTGNLWTGTPSVGPRHPFAHTFDGDTLIFHADATSANTDLYEGPIFAWRPGWSVPRQISTNKGVTCAGHFRGEVALCLDNIEPDVTQPLEFDLHAGPLPAAGGQPLPRVDRIHALRANDVTKWRAGFSRDATQFCYSTGRTSTDAESLWCYPTAALPAKAVPAGNRPDAPLVVGAARWQFARDGQKLYFLNGFNYSDQGDTKGALTMVDYPTGANPVVMNPDVGAFLLLSDGTDTDRGIGLFTQVAQNRGTLRFIRDRSAPQNSVLIAASIASATVSNDLRYTFFNRNINEQTGLADAYVARNEEATAQAPAPSCALQTRLATDLYGTPFLDKAGLVFWVDDVDPNVLVGKGMVANPADCSGKQQYANDIDFWFTVNDEGLIFSDDTDIDIVSLRYARVPDGKTWPVTGPVKVQDQASRIYSMTLPTYNLMLVQIDQGFPSDGIYYVNLPFGGPPVPVDGGAPDGGASDGGADAAQ